MTARCRNVFPRVCQQIVCCDPHNRSASTYPLLLTVTLLIAGGGFTLSSPPFRPPWPTTTTTRPATWPPTSSLPSSLSSSFRCPFLRRPVSALRPRLTRPICSLLRRTTAHVWLLMSRMRRPSQPDTQARCWLAIQSKTSQKVGMTSCPRHTCILTIFQPGHSSCSQAGHSSVILHTRSPPQSPTTRSTTLSRSSGSVPYVPCPP